MIPGEMRLGGPIADILGAESQEVVRVWVTNNGPCTALINPHVLDDPAMFGMLMADTLRHAARAYSAGDAALGEDATLATIWASLRGELDAPTTDLITQDSGGRPN